MSEETSSEPGGRKRGRRSRAPRRAKEDQLTQKVSVRLSEAELKELAAQAKKYACTKAAVLRAAWLQLPLTSTALPEVLLPSPQPARVLTVAELADYKQLLGIATNLNQLTKQTHLGADVQTELNSLLADLRALLAELRPPHQKRTETPKE